MERAEGAPPVEAGRSRGRLLLALLPWLAPALAWTLGLHHTGTSTRDIAIYVAYLAVAIVVPGTLVHRALRGSRGNLPEDLGLGSATGLLLMILGWALGAATRLQAFLWVWPLLVIVLFLAVPRLRRHWRLPREGRTEVTMLWSWVVAGVAFALVMVIYPFWKQDPLPPTTVYYYQDLMYHLALVHEMTRSIPFQVPQLTGDTLRYTYLSDADMAAASMITKIPAPVVLLRLWIVPIGLSAALVCAALTRELTGKWWAGALGSATALFASPLVLGSVTSAFGDEPVAFYSPSQTYALPLLGLLIAVSVDVLRKRRLGWAWVMVLPLALACAGAKSSTLPPMVAGLALAAVFVLFRDRSRLRATLALFGLVLVAMLIATRIFAGGGASSLTVQPFAILDFVPAYRRTIGSGDAIDGSLALPTGLAHAGAAGWAFAFGIFAWWVVMQGARLLGLFTLATRRTRGEASAWLLGGLAIAGTGGAWLLWHPAASQIYFFMTAAPFAAVLTVWLLADQARGWRPVVAGLAAGVLWAIFVPTGISPHRNTIARWAWTLAEPLLVSAAVAALVALVALVAWRVATGRYAWRAIVPGLIAAVLGAAMLGSMEGNARSDYSALFRHQKPDRPERAITADEMRAALWLEKNSGRDDVIATNVHCQPLSWVAACDARAFWVTGLAGRRTLVESWAYTDQAVAADGVNGKRFSLQPAPYPARFALNQRVFAQGDAADVAQLRTEYHVRWLYADTRAQGGVSPNLARVAKLRYRAGTASIYEL